MCERLTWNTGSFTNFKASNCKCKCIFFPSQDYQVCKKLIYIVYFYFSISLFIILSVSMPVCLFVFSCYLSVCLSVSVICLCLASLCLCVLLLSVCVSCCSLSVCLSCCVSILVSVYLFVCLCIWEIHCGVIYNFVVYIVGIGMCVLFCLFGHLCTKYCGNVIHFDLSKTCISQET